MELGSGTRQFDSGIPSAPYALILEGQIGPYDRLLKSDLHIAVSKANLPLTRKSLWASFHVPGALVDMGYKMNSIHSLQVCNNWPTFGSNTWKELSVDWLNEYI